MRLLPRRRKHGRHGRHARPAAPRAVRLPAAEAESLDLGDMETRQVFLCRTCRRVAADPTDVITWSNGEIVARQHKSCAPRTKAGAR